MINDIVFTSRDFILELDNTGVGSISDLTFNHDVYLILPSAEVSVVF